MKKVTLSVLSLSLLLAFGCASKDYVRQQTEPLVERISKLEAKEDCCEKMKAGTAGAAKEAKEAAHEAAKKCEKAFELQQQK